MKVGLDSLYLYQVISLNKCTYHWALILTDFTLMQVYVVTWAYF